MSDHGQPPATDQGDPDWDEVGDLRGVVLDDTLGVEAVSHPPTTPAQPPPPDNDEADGTR